MSREKLVVQTTRKGSSVPLRETCSAPMPLSVCCLCGRIRDETGPSPDREHWVTQRTYRKSHGINPVDSPLTHTYCPKCFTKFQETVRQFFQKSGTSG
jgi:NMD protein affecting ribosome stability and mRNA decay